MGAQSARWSTGAARIWAEETDLLRGVNYLPRTAVNSVEMWSAEAFDPVTIDKELMWAQRVGYNGLRVFLQYIVWRDDPAGFRERFSQFLSIAHYHGMRVLPVLFDDCSYGGSEPRLGAQPAPVPGVHNSRWTPSPGLSMVLDPERWMELREYVTDLIGAYGRNERVMGWDIYNEPGNGGLGEESLPLVEAAFSWARDAEPRQPLTAAVWDDVGSAVSAKLCELSDVISFHAYEAPTAVRRRIEALARHDRPMICTEWLNRPGGNTFHAMVPLFAEYRIGWIHWGLVAGKTQTNLHWESREGDPAPEVWQHDVFYPNGKPFNATELELVRSSGVESLF